MKRRNKTLTTPLLLALPFLAGLLVLWLRWGQTALDALAAGLKLAVRP